MPVVELLYDDDGSEHDDIVLLFGDAVLRSDSYWLARDNRLPDDQPAARVRLALAELLRQWEHDVTTLEVRDWACLPWDFSDQYSGWVRVKRDDANWVTLAAVTTLMVQGMFLAATDYGPQVPHITNFTEDHDIPRLQLTRDDLLAAIRTNRAH